MRRRVALVGALAVMGTLALQAPASADQTSGSDVHAGSHGRTRWVQVSDVHFDGPVDESGDSSGVPADWNPPACWYVPTYTSAAMKDIILNIANTMHHVPDMQRKADDYRDQYGNFHKGEAGKYAITKCSDPASPEALKWINSHDPYVWVPKGADPPDVLTPHVLSELMRAKIKLPKPDISINPARRSFVRLPTWVWITGAATEPVSVTAGIPDGPSATLTARPTHVEIDPGTRGDRATLHPASGVCPGTGKPYNGNPKATPPCGVTYTHSTADVPGQAYHLTATVEWAVTWSGSDGSGGTLPTGRVSDTADIRVAEVQTTVDNSR
ncbi:MAG: hypothetical protein ACRDN9_11395 [Streptosporangiaceae bacterium]